MVRDGSDNDSTGDRYIEMTVTLLRWKPRHRRAICLLGICLLGVVLHVYHVRVATAISPDGALLIEYARRMGEDFTGALRSYDQHPLFPGMIRLAHEAMSFFREDGPEAWIGAGRSVALIGYLGAILGAYCFTAHIYGRRRGLIAAAVMAVLPDASRLGADVLTDMPHTALYLFGAGALLAGLRTGRTAWLLSAAGVSALAFLTRPEGGAVLLVGMMCVLARRGFTVKKRVLDVAAMVMLFFAMTAPYQIATGKLVPKKSLLELFNLASGSRSDRLQAVAPTLGWPALGRDFEDSFKLARSLPVPVDVAYQWFRAGRVIYVLLAILGLCWSRPRGRPALVLGLAAGIHLLLMHALEYRYEYLDRRHALLLVVLSLPAAAAGIRRSGRLITRRIGSRAGRGRTATTLAIIGCCVAITGYWLLRPINRGDEHVVAGGRWLAANTPAGTTIIADSRLRRVALYADRPFFEWRWWGGKVRYLADALQTHPRSWFVVDLSHMTGSEADGNPRFFEELSDYFGARLELMHAEASSAPSPRTELRFYRYASD